MSLCTLSRQTFFLLSRLKSLFFQPHHYPPPYYGRALVLDRGLNEPYTRKNLNRLRRIEQLNQNKLFAKKLFSLSWYRELSKRVIEGFGACSFFSFWLVKAESAGSRIDAFFRAFLGLAVSSALVAAASLSAYDSNLDVGRNFDRSRSSLVKELILKFMRLLMQIRLI